MLILIARTAGESLVNRPAPCEPGFTNLYERRDPPFVHYVRLRFVRLFGIVCAFVATIASAAEPALAPASVCDILRKPAEYAGRTVLLLGRFSFRDRGRFLSDKSCEAKTWASTIRVVIDSKSGPKPPEKLTVDSAVLDSKLSSIKKSTTLANFRFGSTDYDRWGLVYGEVEFSPEFPAGAPPAAKGEFEPAPGRIVCRGEALVVFIADR